mgnify:CR=1 FL=1
MTGVQTCALPICGSRDSDWRTAGNLVTVFVLCGLWHGQMYQKKAKVVSAADFSNWIDGQVALNRGIVQYLPPYAHTYFPQPFYRGG